MNSAGKMGKIEGYMKFSKSIGIGSGFFGVSILNNLVAKTLGGIGIGLLIPLANGVIRDDFSLVTNSSIFKSVGKVFPGILGLGNLGIFILLASLILVLNILKSVINYKIDLYQEKKNLVITTNATRVLFREQISLGKAFSDQTNAGAHATQMSRVPVQISGVLESINIIIGSTAEVVVYSLILIFISPALFFMTFPLVPLSLLFIVHLRKKIRDLSKEEINSDTNMITGFYNSIIKTSLIRIYNTESEEIRDFDKFCKDFEEKKFELEKVLNFIKPVQDIIIFVLLFTVVLILRVNSGVNIGSLVVFFIVFRMLLNSINSVVSPIILIPRKMAVVINVKNRLRKHSLKNRSRGKVVFEKIKDNIVCKDLHFAYDTGKPVLRRVNCTFLKNRITAIVGKSGSGKTTLVNLILKLYNVKDGSIFFDGVDINEFAEETVRSPFSYVSQDILLFDDTLRNNICYGLKEVVSDSEIIKIIKEVGLEYILDKFNDGLDTNIGDRGVQLSGGERQRVALARALLNKSSIIIFDEPTSSVDVETEVEILNLIKKYKEDKTVIIIAHSFLTIKDADHIILIEDGRTKEEGSIKKLLDKGGKFSELWNYQKDLL